MPIIKKSTSNNAGWGMEKRGPSYTVGGHVNCYSCYGEKYGGFFKKLKIELPYDPAIPVLAIYPEKNMAGKDACLPPPLPQPPQATHTVSIAALLQQPEHGSNLNVCQQMSG